MNNKDNEENNLYVSFENKDKFQNININNAKFQMDFTYSPNIE